ncbi:MAG: hypothetical protein SWY16_21680 [Cyanobacteriota bacterium]|nr:hypothetical protein [Cyanobacteriota bacterium]
MLYFQIPTLGSEYVSEYSMGGYDFLYDLRSGYFWVGIHWRSVLLACRLSNLDYSPNVLDRASSLTQTNCRSGKFLACLLGKALRDFLNF